MAFGHLDPGVPRVLGTVKSRKVAILATLLCSGQNGPRCRLGPPESSEKPGKPESVGKSRKTRFLRVARANGRPWAHSVPRAPLGNRQEAWHIACQSPSSTMRGFQGSWSPGSVIGHLDGGLRVPGLSRPRTGALDGPSYVCMESVNKFTDGVGFVGPGLEARTSLRSLVGTRVGSRAIEGP